MSGRKPQTNIIKARRERDDHESSSTRTTNDLPLGFDVVVDGRTCGKVEVDWDAIRELGRDGLRNGFSGRETPATIPSVQEDGGHVRRIDLAVIEHLLSMLPEKINCAVGDAINEALTGALHAGAKARGYEAPLVPFVKGILKPEERRIKQRLAVHRGAPQRKQGARQGFRKSEFKTQLVKLLRQFAGGAFQPTRKAIAQRLGVGVRTLDRLIKKHCDGKTWRDLVAEHAGRINIHS